MAVAMEKAHAAQVDWTSEETEKLLFLVDSGTFQQKRLSNGNLKTTISWLQLAEEFNKERCKQRSHSSLRSHFQRLSSRSTSSPSNPPAEEQVAPATAECTRTSACNAESFQIPSGRCSFQFSQAGNPDRTCFVMSKEYHAGIEPRIVEGFVRHAGLLHCSAFGGAPDQRTMDGRAMKTEGGSKSTVRG